MPELSAQMGIYRVIGLFFVVADIAAMLALAAYVHKWLLPARLQPRLLLRPLRPLGPIMARAAMLALLPLSAIPFVVVTPRIMASYEAQERKRAREKEAIGRAVRSDDLEGVLATAAGRAAAREKTLAQAASTPARRELGSTIGRARAEAGALAVVGPSAPELPAPSTPGLGVTSPWLERASAIPVPDPRSIEVPPLATSILMTEGLDLESQASTRLGLADATGTGAPR